MMRTFFSIVLLCAACGDNLLDTEKEGPPVGDDPGLEDPYARFVPDVCAARSWPTIAFADRDVDLAVIPTLTGAAVFSVDRAGGPLRGFAIADNGLLETKEQGNTVRDDMTFVGVAAALVDERIVTAAISDDGKVVVDLVRADLSSTVNLDTTFGTMVADVPMTPAREGRLVAIGDDDGIDGVRFDAGWQAMGEQQISKNAPLSMTATRYREDSMIAWSTSSTCHLTRVSAEITSSQPSPCLNARVATSNAERRGFMVYEEGADKIMIAEIHVGTGNELAPAQLLVQPARAPKIVFDGSRFWVSYINARQDVVVGYVGKDNTLVSMALEGTQPLADGYELAVLGGFPWVFAVDGAGANAQRLCLKAVR
jgi:hypothetical protein